MDLLWLFYFLSIGWLFCCCFISLILSPWFDLGGWLDVKHQLSVFSVLWTFCGCFTSFLFHGPFVIVLFPLYYSADMTLAVDWTLKTYYLSIFCFMDMLWLFYFLSVWWLFCCCFTSFLSIWWTFCGCFISFLFYGPFVIVLFPLYL